AVREIAVVPKPARTEVIHVVRTLPLLLNHNERFRIRHRRRAQDERFDGTQYDGRRAEPDRENSDDGGRECRCQFDRACGEARVGIEPGERAGDSLDQRTPRTPRLFTFATSGRVSLERGWIRTQT